MQVGKEPQDATEPQEPCPLRRHRRLKQGAHRYRRQEAMTCRDPEKEVNILVEKLKKEQPSD